MNYATKSTPTGRGVIYDRTDGFELARFRNVGLAADVLGEATKNGPLPDPHSRPPPSTGCERRCNTST